MPRKIISETVARGCSVKRFPEKFRKLHRKTPVMKSVLEVKLAKTCSVI